MSKQIFSVIKHELKTIFLCHTHHYNQRYNSKAHEEKWIIQSNFRWRLQYPTAIGYDFIDIAVVSLSAENNKHYRFQGLLSIIEIFVGFLLDFGHF